MKQRYAGGTAAREMLKRTQAIAHPQGFRGGEHHDRPPGRVRFL